MLWKDGGWAFQTAEGGPQVYTAESYSSAYPLIINPPTYNPVSAGGWSRVCRPQAVC